MGGPCRLTAAGETGSRRGPPCTDSFQRRRFEFEGATFQSCAHAYQASKFFIGSHGWRVVAETTPHPGESDAEYGNRLLRLGNRTKGLRRDWESSKVSVLLEVNRAKCAAIPPPPRAARFLTSMGQVRCTPRSAGPAAGHGHRHHLGWRVDGVGASAGHAARVECVERPDSDADPRGVAPPWYQG